MPATAPPGKQPERGEKVFRRSYKVVGPHSVHGAKTGDSVELELTEAQAGALIEAGHIAPASMSLLKEGAD